MDRETVVKLTVGRLRPDVIEREARIRLELTVDADETLDPDLRPYFAFTSPEGRPASWMGGQWRGGVVAKVAQTPMVGRTVVLAAGSVSRGWVRVRHDGEDHVLPCGFVRVK